MTSARYSVSIVRAAPAARFEVVGPADGLTVALQAAGLPVPKVPSTAIVGAGRARVALVGPRRMIVTDALDERARLGSDLRAGVPRGAAVAVADMTGSTATFVLQGSGIEAVLAQGFAHDVSSIAGGTDRVLATDGWGAAAIVEHLDGGTAVTVDASLGDYIEHMLRTAAGLPSASKPGVMRAPPPPIRTAG